MKRRYVIGQNDWLRLVVWYGVIPLLTIGSWALVFFGGRWLIGRLCS